jgi:predicted lactoylglutathione lyase
MKPKSSLKSTLVTARLCFGNGDPKRRFSKKISTQSHSPPSKTLLTGTVTPPLYLQAQEEEMMQPNFVILYVNDPGASAAFYSRLFGSDPVEASPTFVMFALQSGMKFGLWIRNEVSPAAKSQPGAMELDIAVDSRSKVDFTLAEWRAAGVSVVLEPTQLDFGYGFVAQDPDGHLLRVFNPGSPESA